jgi:hypothetical protein
MKTSRVEKTKAPLSHGVAMPVHRVPATGTHHLPGSITDMYPVTLDGGKTVIFISDKSKESETRHNYELRKEQRMMRYGKKYKEGVTGQ